MKLYNKIIYKKDTKGKIRFLEVRTSNIGQLEQISGIIDTKNPILHSKICKPKNIGKSNETTAHDQAVKEAEAIIKEKLTLGYNEDIDELNELDDLVILPMLANDAKKRLSKIDWDKDDVYVQPKLDGMRCLKSRSILRSRKNKIIANMGHIESELSYIKDILDGELYVHGEDFQTNMEYIKSYKPGLSEKIQYWVYDMILPNHNFRERSLLVQAIIKENLEKTKTLNIIYVPTYKIHSEEELKAHHERFLNEGFEGTMIRISNEGYGINKRSNQLLKYKDFQDIAIPIKDIVPCKTMTNWGEPIFDWPGAKGSRHGKDILGAGTKLSHELKCDLLANKHLYIGKTAEVRFFEYSNTGVPRFPVMVGIRLDK
jgi:hypothetical protein